MPIVAPMFASLASLLLAAATASPELTVSPPTARPGSPVLVTVRGVAEAPKGELGGRELRFWQLGGAWRAITGLPVEQAPGALAVRVDASGRELTGAVEVLAPNWRESSLEVKRVFSSPPPEIAERTERDRAAFAAAFTRPFAAPRFALNFALPRKAAISAPFGDRRLFNGVQESQHYGIDFAGKVGAPVNAANDGVVVLVRDGFASGRSVVLDHGADVYSVYFHLSRVDVKEGDVVKRGRRVGAVGRTGRVTGPHLHFGVRVAGLYVDPQELFALDFTK